MKNKMEYGNLKNVLESRANLHAEGIDEHATVIRKVLTFKEVLPVDIDETNRRYPAVISTLNVDHDGDVMLPQPDLSVYGPNSVIFWNHDYSIPPIGKMIDLAGNERGLTGTIEIAKGVKLSDDIWTLVKGGYLRACSVGFIIKKAVLKGDQEFQGLIDKALKVIPDLAVDKIKRVITDWLMLENSIVGLPCNPEALAVSYKSFNLAPSMVKSLGIVEKDAPAEPVLVEPPAVIPPVVPIVPPVEPPKAVPPIVEPPAPPVAPTGIIRVVLASMDDQLADAREEAAARKSGKCTVRKGIHS